MGQGNGNPGFYFCCRGRSLSPPHPTPHCSGFVTRLSSHGLEENKGGVLAGPWGLQGVPGSIRRVSVDLRSSSWGSKGVPEVTGDVSVETWMPLGSFVVFQVVTRGSTGGSLGASGSVRSISGSLQDLSWSPRGLRPPRAHFRIYQGVAGSFKGSSLVVLEGSGRSLVHLISLKISLNPVINL